MGEDQSVAEEALRRLKAYREEAGVDWSRTRAFALGLTGIFLNIKDRYGQGIVAGGQQAERLREEIAQRLAPLVDPETGTVVYAKAVTDTTLIARAPRQEAIQITGTLDIHLSRSN